MICRNTIDTEQLHAVGSLVQIKRFFFCLLGTYLMVKFETNKQLEGQLWCKSRKNTAQRQAMKRTQKCNAISYRITTFYSRAPRADCFGLWLYVAIQARVLECVGRTALVRLCTAIALLHSNNGAACAIQNHSFDEYPYEHIHKQHTHMNTYALGRAYCSTIGRHAYVQMRVCALSFHPLRAREIKNSCMKWKSANPLITSRVELADKRMVAINISTMISSARSV